MAYTEEQKRQIALTGKLGNASFGNAGGSPWGYTPSQAVTDTVEGIRSGAYKNQGTYADTNQYASAIGADTIPTAMNDPMYTKMLQESMAADNAGAIKKQNELSANGKQASDKELANMYLYNAFQNMSEDDQNEVYRQLQADLPYDQQGNPVDIKNAFETWRYGDYGVDNEGNVTRSGGYEDRLGNYGKPQNENERYLEEAQADFNKAWAPYKAELLNRGIPEDEVNDYIEAAADRDNNLSIAWQGLQSAKGLVGSQNTEDNDYFSSIVDSIVNKADAQDELAGEGFAAYEERKQKNNLMEMAKTDFDANQVYAQNNPDEVVGIDNETGLYIFKNQGDYSDRKRYHLFSAEERMMHEREGFTNSKNNPNAGYFQ